MKIALIIYIIGIALTPISTKMHHKIRKIDFTVGDLIFCILTCWLSWIIVIINLLMSINTKEVLIKYNK